MNRQTLKVAIAGASWWIDAMYLPALKNLNDVRVVGVCGRNPENAKNIAESWGVERHFTDFIAMLDETRPDVLMVTSSNDTHAPFTEEAITRGIHVLCEKPLALDYAQARGMAEKAEVANITHGVPFTYAFMPDTRYAKRLVEQGYIGKPLHCDLRYYAGYGLKTGFSWRTDLSKSGGGGLSDVGSHFLLIADWIFGPLQEVSCRFSYQADRPDTTPEGKPYERSEDSAAVWFTFAEGAYGMLHASTVALEETPFGQTHGMEFFGDGGSIKLVNDWDKTLKVFGQSKSEGGPSRELSIPSDILGSCRTDTVHNTYRDVFRRENRMIGDFLDCVRSGGAFPFGFREGARIQAVLDAAALSHRENRVVRIAEITGD